MIKAKLVKGNLEIHFDPIKYQGFDYDDLLVYIKSRFKMINYQYTGKYRVNKKKESWFFVILLVIHNCY